MATFTDNFALVKPTYGELADVAVINGNMDTVDGIMHSNRTMLAPAFSQTEDYAVGDIVVYEGNLYRFIVPHTAGNWDGTEVEQTTLGEEVATKGGADVTKTASGNPIEISDGASAPLVKCDVTITGSQDLHGYDKPWVGGSGKNILYNEMASPQTVNGLTAITNDDGSITINGTATANTTIYLTNRFIPAQGSYIFSGSNGGSSSTYGLFINVGTEYRFVYDEEISYTSDGVTQIYAAIRVSSGATLNNVKFYPMLRANGTTADFTPYSNICPITAYTEGEIEVRGKNLVSDIPDGSSSGITITHDSDGYCVINGTSQNAYLTVPLEKPMTLNGTYTWSLNNPQALSGDASIRFGNDTTTSIYFRTANNTKTVTLTNYYITSYMLRVPTGVQFSNFKIKLMFEKGSSATDYEPYTSTTHTTTYPSAIYRGSEDVVKGEVESEWPVIELPSTGWMQEGDYAGVYTNYSFGVSNSYPKLICSVATRGTSYSNILNNDGRIGISASRIIWHESSFASANDLMTYLSNNVVQIAYELATPQTSSVTPTNLPIKSLNGYTHIESTTGDMEIEYITEEYQPLVDLIESNSGKHEYSTNEQVVGTWTDGKDIFERVFDWSSDPINIPAGGWSDTPILTADVDSIISIRGISPTKTMWNNLASAVDSGTYVTILNPRADTQITVAKAIIQYIKSTPTRSLNLTKSAVTEKKDEIPEEIKNAPFEEKPDVNEADDSAPTEVDER